MIFGQHEIFPELNVLHVQVEIVGLTFSDM